MQHCAAICNDAEFEASADNMDQPVMKRACVNGNATAFGTLKFAEMDTNTPNVATLSTLFPLSVLSWPTSLRACLNNDGFADADLQDLGHEEGVYKDSLLTVETFGATSSICSDKTGALTEKRKTASHVCCEGVKDPYWVAPNGEGQELPTRRTRIHTNSCSAVQPSATTRSSKPRPITWTSRS